jgi:alpha-N-arabinofuranosidase
LFSWIITCILSALNAKTFVVNNQTAEAKDSNPGTCTQPLRTVQAGANLAQAGDTILVKAGIYRDEVKPLRSGTRDKPITYLAAPGDIVSIRGSEQIANWIREENGLWLAAIDNAMFDGFNPYTTNVSGAWLQGSETSDNKIKYHLGDVYFNDEAFYEVFSTPDCQGLVNSWVTVQENGKTLLHANFGTTNPNAGFSEINVRATAFFPEISGLKYIVIDGFDIRHTASQWSDIYKLEEGAIGMKYGYGWVIQNCTITNSRNNGISMGVTNEVFFSRTLSKGGDNIPPYGSFGFHIIRNNKIKRCGQCGIYGCYGAVGSVIENNEISETVYRNEWSGPNQADIKILFPIDVIIRNNKFFGTNGVGRAIWLDWGSQNVRVTKNLIIDRKEGVFTEVSFGPTVVDNNIFIRSGIRDWSDGNIYAHNLFYQIPCFHLMAEPNRPFVPYYKPHSTELAGRNETKLRNERWYNNIFIEDTIRKIPEKVDNTSGFLVNHNVYLDEAFQFPFEGDESIRDNLKSEFEFEDNSINTNLFFKLGKLIFERIYPLITSKMIGKMPLPQVFMENPDGTPLDITIDYFGNSIDSKHAMPGPFQKISSGINKFSVWPNPGVNYK